MMLTSMMPAGRLKKGFGLLFVLVGVLVAILSSRAVFLRSGSMLPRPPALTWTEMPVEGAANPSSGSEPDPSAGPQTPDSSSGNRAADPPSPEASRPKAEPTPEAFTLEFGTFVTAREAEEIENRLNRLGASTIRHRKPSEGALYAVEVGDFPTAATAREAREQLRLRHPSLALGESKREGDARFAIVVDAFYPLREAVALAEQLRADGFAVRIKSARGSAPLYSVRMAETYTLKSAQEKSREFRNQGLPNAVVPLERRSSP